MTNKIGVGDYRSTKETEQLMLRTLRQGRLTYGPLSKEFERKFAELHNVKHAILCSSGTDALRIALRALRIERGWQGAPRVIVPSVTFVATLNTVIDEGFTPVIVDVDPMHYHLSPRKTEQALKEYPDIVAAVPVHLFGQPVNNNLVFELMDYYGVAVLEDSCECMYAQADGVSVGAMGDIAAFSTYAAHLVTTGVGGIVTTNNTELARLSRSLANHGRDGIYISIDDDNGGSQEIIEKRFKFDYRGFSSRITELQAAVGLPQLDTLPQDIERRQHNAAKLTELLQPYTDRLRLPSVRHGNTHSFMMYPIVLETGDKWDLINFLENNGIETREMLPLTNQPCYAAWIDEDDYPVAQFINRQGFYIGCHQYITDIQIEYIGAVFQSYFERQA